MHAYPHKNQSTATQLQPVNYTAAALRDEVTALPGLPPALTGAFRQFSGYLPISTDKYVGWLVGWLVLVLVWMVVDVSRCLSG